MAKLKIDQLQAGMVVTADVKNIDDVLLVPAGCTLSERHIRILRTWGIPEAHVKTGREEGTGSQIGESSAVELPPELIQKIKARFWDLDEANAVHQEILRLVLRREQKAASHP